MTLGIAASNSTSRERNARICRGQISVKNSAVPKESGTAISRATKDETRVPYMKGSAPKSSATGSQMVWMRKRKPNLLLDKCDCDTSSKQISPTETRRASAHPATIERKAASAKKLSLVLSLLLGIMAKGFDSAGVEVVEPASAGCEAPAAGGLGTVYMDARYQIRVKGPLKRAPALVKPAPEGAKDKSSWLWRSTVTARWVA